MIKDGKPFSNENGFIDDWLLTDLPDEKQQKVLSWISDNFIKIGTVNYDITSYGLKHRLEDCLGIYLSNNQFKDAMMQCGFYPSNPNELNWNFRISKKSPVIKEYNDCLRRMAYIEKFRVEKMSIKICERYCGEIYDFYNLLEVKKYKNDKEDILRITYLSNDEGKGYWDFRLNDTRYYEIYDGGALIDKWVNPEYKDKEDYGKIKNGKK